MAGVAAAGRGGWVSSAGDGGGAGREERRDRRADSRARRPPGSPLAPRVLLAVGLRAPTGGRALGQGSDRSQI